jgi:hypothetical protein
MMMEEKLTRDRIIDAIFQSEQFNGYCSREGDLAVFTSGYGSGPITIDVRAIVEIMIDIWTR